MSTPQSTLLFERLRSATNPELQQVAPMVPYLEEGKPIPLSSNYHDQYVVGNFFLDKLSFALAHIPADAELKRLRSRLEDRSSKNLPATVEAVRVYAEKHPELRKDAPILEIVQALPEDFVWFYTKSPTRHLVGHLAAGSLRLPQEMDAKELEAQPFDVPQLVRVFRAAEAVYVSAWKKNDPENLRIVKKEMARLEWEEANTLWKDPEASTQFENIKDTEAVLRFVATELSPPPERKARLAWPLFLKKLWEEEGLLRTQFYKVTEPNGDADRVEKYLHDQRFEETLAKIGEQLAPLATLGTKRTKEVGPEDYAALAKETLQKSGIPVNQAMLDLYLEGVRKIQWEEILKFKGHLQRAVKAPQLFERALQFTEGFFRDFLLYESWKREPQKTPEMAEKYLAHMQKEMPDGAKANRAADLMSRYVKAHYSEGTLSDQYFQYHYMTEKVEQIPVSQNDFYAKSDKERGELMRGLELQLYSSPKRQSIIKEARAHDPIEYSDASMSSVIRWAHYKRKEAARNRWSKEKTTPPNYLFVFSDSGSRRPDQEVMTDTSHAMRIFTTVANQEATALREGINSVPLDMKLAQKLREFVDTHLKGPSLLKDFYFENLFNYALWNFLTQSSIGVELEKRGIQLRTIDVDLKDNFDGKDDGVLQDAYFTKYTLFRVEGLLQNIKLFTVKEKETIADLLRDFSAQMTPSAAEGFERMAIELEAEKVARMYQDIYQDRLPKTPASDEEQRRAAADQSFARVSHYIQERFPTASYNRDDLLERFALNYAQTPDHVRQVEELMYAYLVRNPKAEEEKGEKVVFGPVEAVKNYLAVFQDRWSRARILGWIFGGELPDDRYLEGERFNVNADAEREVFWLMSQAERRAVLYNALMGKNGLFEVSSEWKEQGNNDQQVFLRFLQSFYEHNFAAVLKGEEGKESMEETLNTIFFEIFKRYSTPRRIELFLSITERMREVRMKGEKLTAGQAMRLFLEQVGVVGIKAGQVISEQKGLVSDDIKSELSSLRDRAAPFSKFGVFTYLRLAGLFGDTKGETTPPFQITQVGECLGSASIKQAHLAWTKEGKALVVKVPRPTIDKNYEEDVRALESVFAALRKQGAKVPEYLLKEIVDACTAEFNFGEEGSAQRDMDAALYKRSARVALEQERGEGSPEAVRLDVPDLEFLLRKGESRVANLQLMVDEYIPGFSLIEAEEYQRLCRGSLATSEAQARKAELEQKLTGIYHEYAPLARRDFENISMESVRAQIALDLIEQIVSDGVFHSDLHSGNVRIDLHPKAKRVALIDFGSVGRSVEVKPEGVVDHRSNFREFLQNLMFLKMGLGDTGRLGALVAEYVKFEGYDARAWSERVAELNATHDDLGSFFKELLTDIVAQKAEIHRQFKMLLKSLAAAGGHFDALRNYLTRAFGEASEKAAKEGKPVGEILLQYPGMEKLRSLVQGNPQMSAMLGV